MATPTPMPAFAPVDSPLLGAALDVGVADEVGVTEAGEGDLVRVGVEDVLEVVLDAVPLGAPKVCALSRRSLMTWNVTVFPSTEGSKTKWQKTRSAVLL